MKISTKGRYATRAMMDLALNYDKSPVMLKDISHRQGIPLRYLEQIVTPLISAQLIRSIRGPKGGIVLARPPQNIKLLDIVQVMEGSLVPVDCVADPGLCARASDCAARDLWADLSRAINKVLGSTTLQYLVEMQTSKKSNKFSDYCI